MTTTTPSPTATSTATATAALLLVVLFMVCLLQRCCGTVLAKGGRRGLGVGASGSVEKPRLGLGGLLCNEAKRLTLFVRFFARCFVCFFFETGIPCEYGNPSPSSSLHLCQLLAWAQPLHPYSAQSRSQYFAIHSAPFLSTFFFSFPPPLPSPFASVPSSMPTLPSPSPTGFAFMKSQVSVALFTRRRRRRRRLWPLFASFV